MQLNVILLIGALAGLEAVLARHVVGRQAEIQCPAVPSPFPTWQQLPLQKSLPDPFLPLKFVSSDPVADVVAGKSKNRIKTKEEWYACRKPEILQMLQEYQFGYYPDHSKEKVEATRSGTTINIVVTADGKTGRFRCTVTLPSGASASKPAPVVINIGGMANQPYLSAGIAVAQFDYTSVSPDSNSKTGAFWDLYKGRDIGECCLELLEDAHPLTESRHLDGMGMGIPSRPRRHQHDSARDRLEAGGCDGMLAAGQGGAGSRPV